MLWKIGPINTMYGVPPRGHLQGQTQGHMSYHTLFEGIYFALSRSTHIWNAYVAENLLKNKKNAKNGAWL